MVVHELPKNGHHGAHGLGHFRHGREVHSSVGRLIAHISERVEQLVAAGNAKLRLHLPAHGQRSMRLPMLAMRQAPAASHNKVLQIMVGCKVFSSSIPEA